MSAPTKILVPTDFSEASGAALRYACGLADALSASLCILHTVENAFDARTYPELQDAAREYFKRFERDARAQLEAVLTPEEKAKYRATFALRTGIAADEILQVLHDQRDIDLVVMATHGRGGVARLLIGSVADKVVRAARCPVVTIRIPDVDEPQEIRAAQHPAPGA